VPSMGQPSLRMQRGRLRARRPRRSMRRMKHGPPRQRTLAADRARHSGRLRPRCPHGLGSIRCRGRVRHGAPRRTQDHRPADRHPTRRNHLRAGHHLLRRLTRRRPDCDG
jgi:hypothetical protein